MQRILFENQCLDGIGPRIHPGSQTILNSVLGGRLGPKSTLGLKSIQFSMEIDAWSPSGPESSQALKSFEFAVKFSWRPSGPSIHPDSGAQKRRILVENQCLEAHGLRIHPRPLKHRVLIENPPGPGIGPARHKHRIIH